MKTCNIRIAICGCIPHYHGRLEGRSTTIDGIRYVMQEVRLSLSLYHAKELKAERCHFFIDNVSAAMDEGDVWLEVLRLDLLRSPSGKSERLKLNESHTLHTGGKIFQHHDHFCPVNPPITPIGVLRKIRSLIECRSRRERASWLARMAFPPRSAKKRRGGFRLASLISADPTPSAVVGLRRPA